MLAKQFPALAMSKPKDLLLDNMQGNVLLGGAAEALMKIGGV